MGHFSPNMFCLLMGKVIHSFLTPKSSSYLENFQAEPWFQVITTQSAAIGTPRDSFLWICLSKSSVNLCSSAHPVSDPLALASVHEYGLLSVFDFCPFTFFFLIVIIKNDMQREKKKCTKLKMEVPHPKGYQCLYISFKIHGLATSFPTSVAHTVHIILTCSDHSIICHQHASMSTDVYLSHFLTAVYYSTVYTYQIYLTIPLFINVKEWSHFFISFMNNTTIDIHVNIFLHS